VNMGGISITALAGSASVRSCFIILLGIPHYQRNKIAFLSSLFYFEYRVPMDPALRSSARPNGRNVTMSQSYT
jgi:hypothetical protein